MDNLDDATRLIAELTTKLAELDSKVVAYRLDMAAEFTRYSEELLRSVPEDVAYLVSQTIAGSLRDYPSLYPPGTPESLHSVTTAPQQSENASGLGTLSSPPPLQDPSSIQDAEPASRQGDSHNRELEFRGVFTPAFLPLLERADRPVHSPPTSPSKSDTARTSRPSSTGSAAISNSAQRLRRPSPLRRGTDTSLDSLASDSSGAKNRKSALRRSSNSSRPDSPRDNRRVRFDFEGQEVLPSSSPQPLFDPLSQPANVESQSSFSPPETYTTSLSDVEGEEDQQQQGAPRKVSSTQALRRLSKEPLDDATLWTVVNAESTTENLSSLPRTTQSETIATVATPRENLSNSKMGFDEDSEQQKGHRPGKPQSKVAKVRYESSSSESDDEPALFMATKKSKAKDKPMTGSNEDVPTNPTEATVTPRLTTATEASNTSSAVTRSGSLIEPVYTLPISQSPPGKAPAMGKREKLQPSKSLGVDDDEEDFFAFDEDEGCGRSEKTKTTRKRAEKYLARQEEEHEKEESGEEAPDEALAHGGASHIPFASSDKTVTVFGGGSVPTNCPAGREGTRTLGTSIGSYAGRNVAPFPVRDPILLKELQQTTAEVPFFVGSVNGRSGPDASNVKSYQASMLSPNQMSGSFAERYLWEKQQGITYDEDKDQLGDQDRKSKKRTH